MRILFWGTPEFAVPSLRALDDEGYQVVGVVTQPGRPAGRGRHVSPSPVNEVASAMGVPVLAPERPHGEAFLAEVRALAPDASAVVAYGHILRSDVLAVPGLGSINVHASLLPELRGAAPVTWAIARGHEATGVTVMRMVEAMDAGPILHTIREPILADDTGSELSLRLSELSAEALVEALTLMEGGEARPVEQDHTKATYAPKVDRKVARVDWSRPAAEVARHVRAMDDVPGAWSELDGRPIKVFAPRVVDARDPGAVGTILDADGAQGVVVAAGKGAVALDEIQPPGRRRMSAGDWIHGRGVRAGQRFV